MGISPATKVERLSQRSGIGASTSPTEFFTAVVRHRGLIRQLIQRDVIGRYRGSTFGVLWSFFTPLVMLAVYATVFGSIFKTRWGSTEEDVAQFALILFAGLIVFNLFSECVGRAPHLITSNTNYVKKVVFPLEILPWVSFGAAAFHACVSLVVLLIVNVVINHSLQWTTLMFPVVLLPLAFITVGVSWLLAALGAYLRDIGQVIGLAISMLMFLSPLFYPVTAVPEKYRFVMYLNPLTFIIAQAREVLLYGHLPNWGGLACYSVVAMFIAYGGFVFFQRARRGFADVL